VSENTDLEAWTKMITKRVCLRCGHTWWPRSPEEPLACPNPDCHSVYWDRPRKNKTKEEKHEN